MASGAAAVCIRCKRCKMMVQTCSSHYFFFQIGECLSKHDYSAWLQVISFTYVLSNKHCNILLLMSHLSLFCMPVVSSYSFLQLSTLISRKHQKQRSMLFSRDCGKFNFFLPCFLPPSSLVVQKLLNLWLLRACFNCRLAK